MSHPAVRLLLIAVIVLAAQSLRAQSDPPAGFTSLFNGEDLAGWYGKPHIDPAKFEAMSVEEQQKQLREWWKETVAHWTIDNGELVNDGKGPYLTTHKDFGDIELLIDYKTVPLADSGIYLRGTPQVQIWDTTEAGGKWDRNADKGSGGLFNNDKASPGQLPLVNADAPFGEWNHFRIIQVGARTSVWLNEKLVVDHQIMDNYWNRETPLPAKGPIQLQTHGGEIRWRNLLVREIGSDEANEILAAHGDKGFEPIFNGKDLSGWAGAVDEYEVVNGAVVCKPARGGDLYTEAEHANFVARLEFRLPPGGNNGLAIRYPGEGNPAYDGMTELQILDSNHIKYAGVIQPSQFHGSAYGMVAAHDGYLRPTGDWNFQEVTVDGSKIKVELNGTVILDTDLSEVTEYAGNHPHPGKERTTGHFGFAGHGDAVRFRGMRIKTLPATKSDTIDDATGDEKNSTN